jgi:hypothetical protein
MKDRIKVGWRTQYNEQLYYFYSWPDIIITVQSRRMRWAGHVAHKGKIEMHTRFWFERQNARNHWEDIDVGGRIILKRVTRNRIGCYGLDLCDSGYFEINIRGLARKRCNRGPVYDRYTGVPLSAGNTVRSKTYHGYVKPRIIPNAICNVIFV